jgi:methionine aminopeptidase
MSQTILHSFLQSEKQKYIYIFNKKKEIDRIVHEACMERDCYPSPLNYYNFPKSVCISVNEVICHGIPDYREIQDGGTSSREMRESG